MKRFFLIIFYCSCFLLGSAFFLSSEDALSFVSECKEDNPNYKGNDYCKYIEFKDNKCKYNDQEFKFKEGFLNLNKSRDYLYEPHNLVCLGIAASFYLEIFAAGEVMKVGCAITDPRIGKVLSLKNLPTAKKILTFIVKHGVGATTTLTLGDPFITMNVDFAAVSLYPSIYNAYYIVRIASSLAIGDYANATQFSIKATACSTSISLAFVGLQASLATKTGIQHASAKKALKQTRICGHDWITWGYSQLEEGKESKTEWYPIRGAFEGSYKEKVVDCILNSREVINEACDYFNNKGRICEGDDEFCEEIYPYSVDIKNKVYREYLYNGKEYVNPNIKNGTIDPRLPEVKGFNGINQRYYLRGLEAGNYACSRFYYRGDDCILESGVRSSDKKVCKQVFQQAYKRCIQKSTNTICIEDLDSKKFKFCRVGNNCSFGSGIYKAYNSIKEPYKKICIRSFSFCPYNFNIAGGTEKEDLYCDGDYTNSECGKDLDKIWMNGNYPTENSTGIMTESYGKTKNFCQYNAHCTYVPTESFIYKSTTFSKFLDPACKNFIGDSRNIMDIPYATGEGSLDKFGTINLDEEIKKIIIKNTNLSSEVLNNTKITQSWIKAFLQLDITFFEDLSPLVRQEIKNNLVEIQRDIRSLLSSSKIPLKIIDIGKYRGFTAPITQCIRESVKNMFDNRAGLSKCADETMEVNEYGLCGTDTPWDYDPLNYEGEGNYMAGETLPAEENIFYRIQNSVRNVIKLVAILAIIVIGVSFMIGGQYDIFAKPGELRKALIFFVKFGVVFYFATGTAWQSFFYEGLNRAVEFSYYSIFELASGYSGMIRPLEPGESAILEKMQLVEDVGMVESKIVQELDNDCPDNIKECFKIFEYNGVTDYFVVPEGVSSLEFKAYGAQGGDSYVNRTISFGEKGDYVTGNVSVNPSQPFSIKVGKKGNDCVSINNEDCKGEVGEASIVNMRLEDGTYGSEYLIFANGGNNSEAITTTSLLKSTQITPKVNLGNGVVYMGLNGITNNLNTLIQEKNRLENLNPDKKYKIRTQTIDQSAGVWNNKYDGCYFSGFDYPEGKGYLAIFDTIDCKLAKYLGYTPEVNIPNIILFVISSLVLGGLGVFIFVFSIFFFIVILSIAVKAVYIFLISFIAINLLIFLSPIVFPTLLFKKSKMVFDSWLTNLMGFALQPILLMMFLALYLAVFDKISLGDATFIRSSDGRNAVLNCTRENGERVMNGLVCLFDIKSGTPVKNVSGFLSAFGFDFRTFDINKSLKNDLVILNTLIVFAFLAFVFAKIMDKITTISTALVGGAELKGGELKIGKVSKQVFGFAVGAVSPVRGLLRGTGDLIAKMRGIPVKLPPARRYEEGPERTGEGFERKTTKLATVGERGEGFEKSESTTEKVGKRDKATEPKIPEGK